MMLYPKFGEFKKLARQGNIVPVCREMLADMETPVSVFRKLDAVSQHAFLLESVEQGEQLGRFSFLGMDPAVILRVKGAVQEIISDEKLKPRATPIETLRYLLSRYQPALYPELPPFIGGAVGYMAYDTVRYYERIPDTCPDDLDLPDCVIMIAESLLAFDHVKHRMTLITNARVDTGESLEDVYTRAILKLGYMKGQLSIPRIDSLALRMKHRTANGKDPEPAETMSSFDRIIDDEQAAERGAETGRAFGVSMPVTSNFEKKEFIDIVNKAKEYIAAGDIFQVVLSQRFCSEISCAPFDVYRALRAINPSPYMFYLKCGDEFQIAGSSPEVLSKLQGGKVTVRPIAGTRPRGETPEADKNLELDLLADEKEIAEHVMLVDLGRNDVGRVSRYGTVSVNDFMVIERYSHVMHIVSNVEGTIRDDKDALDVVAATFPAGTLSGAPKIRAMEIIDELETRRRGPYGGTVVYLSFDGSMDSCITIRTAIIRGDKVYVQAGAGVVADSDPEREYLECVNKAKGMLKAIDLAEHGLD